MRALVLSRYGRLGASSRLRTLQYVNALNEYGIEMHIAPLLDDDYVRGLYHGGISIRRVALAYLRRIGQVLGSRRFDLLWVEKELWPWLPAIMELPWLPRSTRLVLDYDDAVFHRYDQHRSALVRRILGRKLDRLMRRSALITAGNEYLADRARMAGARHVEIVPTVIDIERYRFPERMHHTGPVTIGWVGSPSTAAYLRHVSPALESLRRNLDLRCVAIGARPDQVAGTTFEATPWSEDTEVSALSALDIGIMPLPDAPWERGKCGYKLIQYMASGLPVVASPVGVNSEIVSHGGNGFLADSLEEWVATLGTLATDAGLRTRMGAEGRRRVEQTYSLQVQAPRMARFFQEVIGEPAG